MFNFAGWCSRWAPSIVPAREPTSNLDVLPDAIVGAVFDKLDTEKDRLTALAAGIRSSEIPTNALDPLFAQRAEIKKTTDKEVWLRSFAASIDGTYPSTLAAVRHIHVLESALHKIKVAINDGWPFALSGCFVGMAIAELRGGSSWYGCAGAILGAVVGHGWIAAAKRYQFIGQNVDRVCRVIHYSPMLAVLARHSALTDHARHYLYAATGVALLVTLKMSQLSTECVFAEARKRRCRSILLDLFSLNTKQGFSHSWNLLSQLEISTRSPLAGAEIMTQMNAYDRQKSLAASKLLRELRAGNEQLQTGYDLAKPYCLSC